MKHIYEEKSNDISTCNSDDKGLKTTYTIYIDIDGIVTDEEIVPEDFIVCEKQQRLFCGRHALRALVQNPTIFDDSYLISIAQELATEELTLREDTNRILQFYFNPNTGYYDIQVIQTALKQDFNIELIPLTTFTQTSRLLHNLIIDNIYNVQALFIHHNDHYFCLRRFDSTLGYFFIIDSLKPNKHRIIQRNHILNYINYLEELNALIYVPVSADIVQLETISSDLLCSSIHPLSICEADKVGFTITNDRQLIFDSK